MTVFAYIKVTYSFTELYSCNSPPLPKQGTPEVTYPDATKFPHGFVMTYECAHNEELRGDPSTTCSDGTWATATFKCISSMYSDKHDLSMSNHL